MSTLVVLPLQVEAEGFLEALRVGGFRLDRASAGRIPVTRVPELDMVVAVGGHGKAEFAVHTRHLLDHIERTHLAVCAGAAGALTEGIRVGDVVVATATIEHDFQRRFSGRPAPQFAGDPAALESLRERRPGDGSFTLHFGVIASGDEDIASGERATTVRQATGAIAAAWEGAGGARACRLCGTPFVEIRGVTDAANTDAASDFRSNLGVAMRNLATLLGGWLRSR